MGLGFLHFLVHIPSIKWSFMEVEEMDSLTLLNKPTNLSISSRCLARCSIASSNLWTSTLYFLLSFLIRWLLTLQGEMLLRTCDDFGETSPFTTEEYNMCEVPHFASPLIWLLSALQQVKNLAILSLEWQALSSSQTPFILVLWGNRRNGKKFHWK